MLFYQTRNRFYYGLSCFQGKIVFLIFLFVFFRIFPTEAQDEKYHQLWNELQFSRPIADKWSAELYLSGTYSNTPSDAGFLSTNTQRNVVLLANYFYSPRWKFTPVFAYYYNKDVPDIGQFQSDEWRFAMQGTYYFHKISYTLSTRMRSELRIIQNEADEYQSVFRYRQQLKFLKPLNSQILRQGVFYFLVYDEIFFRPNVKTKGITFFDRNQFSLGFGFLPTDDMQLELSYVNEFAPRDDNNQLVHAISVTVSFNNLISNVKKRVNNLFGGNMDE